MAINNQEIVDSITSSETAYRLEAIICRELREWNGLPLETRLFNPGKGIRKQAEAEQILKEAMQEADLFLGEEYSAGLPSLEKKKFRKMPISSYFSNALFIGAGIFVGYQGSKSGDRNIAMIGGLMAGIGISKLGLLISFSKNRSPTIYNMEENKIFWVSGKQQAVKLDMLHAYSHAVAMPILRKQPLYMMVNEGFAAGVSARVMRTKGNLAEHKTALSRSIPLLKIVKNCLKRQRAGKDDFTPLLEKLSKSEPLNSSEAMLANSAGYAFFRLAEEKHGTDVYREVLKGNYENLFC